MAEALTSPGTGSRPAWARRLGLIQDASMVCFSAVFFYIHARHALGAGTLTNVFFSVEQGLLVWMFLTRRRSQHTSPRVFDWAVAALGGWLPLAMRPHESGGDLALFGAGSIDADVLLADDTGDALDGLIQSATVGAILPTALSPE